MNVGKCTTAACTALLKTLLLIFNITFFSLGICFLMVGVYGLHTFRDFFVFTSGQTLYVPIMVMGIIITITGVLSLWFTPKGLAWLLYAYGIIVFILFIVTFSISAAFMVKRSPLEVELKRSIDHSIQIYDGKQQYPIDMIQKHFECCGSTNYTDWFQTMWGKQLRRVPESCCKNPNCTHTNLPDTNATTIYEEGCSEKFINLIEKNYALIGGIGFASSVFILAGSLLSCGLASHIRRVRYELVE